MFTFPWHIHWQNCLLSLDTYTDRGVHCPLTHTLTESVYFPLTHALTKLFTFPWHIHWQRCSLSFNTYTDRSVHCPLNIYWQRCSQRCSLSLDTYTDRSVYCPMTQSLTDVLIPQWHVHSCGTHNFNDRDYFSCSDIIYFELVVMAPSCLAHALIHSLKSHTPFLNIEN